MHIPDGFVSAPINIAAAAASAATVAYALKRVSREADYRKVPLLGVVAAFVFAAQMLNFPVAAGTSGHFMGGVLAAVLLGPFEAVIVMTLVLVLQCLMFADGGITALGSNVFNMGIVGALLGYLVFAGARAALGCFFTDTPFTEKTPCVCHVQKVKGGAGRFAILAAAALASWLSIVAASLACALMLAASGRFPLDKAAMAMGGVHALIGIGEAAITTAALALVLGARPDLVAALRGSGRPASSGAWGFAAVALGVATVFAALVSPFASGDPDGLEKKAIEQSSRQIAASARAELLNRDIAGVVIEANADVAERLEDEASDAHKMLSEASGDTAKLKIIPSEEMGIFAARIVTTGKSGTEEVRELSQDSAVWTFSPIPDYETGIGGDIQSVGLAGLIGTLLTFGVGFALFGTIRRLKR